MALAAAGVAGIRMKLVLVALLLSIPAIAGAASLEDNYFAARDRYIAQFKPRELNVDIDERTRAQEERARADLENQLRRIIGPVKGLPGTGRINLDTLFEGYIGFGLLDGLVYSSPDGKTRTVVTTDALLKHWLLEHKDWWGANATNVPQDVNIALKSEAFYTQALKTDAAIFKYAELPVTRPWRTPFAFAMLVARAQDTGPRTPDELIVAVRAKGRLLIATAPATAAVEPMAECQRIWQEAERRAAQTYNSPDLRDDKRSERSARISDDGDAAFRRCFARHVLGVGPLAALTRQAQSLVQGLRAH